MTPCSAVRDNPSATMDAEEYPRSVRDSGQSVDLVFVPPERRDRRRRRRRWFSPARGRRAPVRGDAVGWLKVKPPGA